METTTAAPAAYQSIPLDKIQPSRHQARKNFDEDAIKGLAESMKLEGLLQPITVRPIGDVFELISGERRVRAAKTLGWPAIDAKIAQPVSEGESAAKGLIENLQRQDLNPIEEAEGFQELNQLDPGYWTHEQIAQVAGRDRTYVTKSINLINLPDEVKDDVRRRTLTRDHGIELLRLPDSARQAQAAKEVVAKELNRAQTRKLVDGMLKPTSDLKPQTAKSSLKSEVRGDHSETSPDPLADIWSDVRSTTATGGIWWEAKYGPHKLPTGDSLNGWFFFAGPVDGQATKEALAGWFREMAQALADGTADKAKTVDEALTPDYASTSDSAVQASSASLASSDVPASSDQPDPLKDGAKQLVTDVAKNLLSNLF